jgi:hypothetical protein
MKKRIEGEKTAKKSLLHVLGLLGGLQLEHLWWLF